MKDEKTHRLTHNGFEVIDYSKDKTGVSTNNKTYTPLNSNNNQTPQIGYNDYTLKRYTSRLDTSTNGSGIKDLIYLDNIDQKYLRSISPIPKIPLDLDKSSNGSPNAYAKALKFDETPSREKRYISSPITERRSYVTIDALPEETRRSIMLARQQSPTYRQTFGRDQRSPRYSKFIIDDTFNSVSSSGVANNDNVQYGSRSPCRRNKEKVYVEETRYYIQKDGVNDAAILALRTVILHRGKNLKIYLLGKWFRTWRRFNLSAKISLLSLQASTQTIKEIPIYRDVIKEVPVVKEVEVIKHVVREVPVYKTEIKEVIKEVPVEKIVYKDVTEITTQKKRASLKSIGTHSDKINKLNILGKHFRWWRKIIHTIKINLLQEELNKKPKELIKEVIKEVQVVKEVFKEVPVVKEIVKEIPVFKEVIKEIPVYKEVIKEVPVFDKIGKETQKRNKLSTTYFHAYKIQRWYILGRYFRKWKKVNNTMIVNSLNSQLDSFKRDNNSTFKNFKGLYNSIHKIKRWYFIGKLFRRWRKTTNSMQLKFYENELSKKPKEIIKEVIKEVIKEIPVYKTEIREVNIEVPVIRKQIVEVVKEVPKKLGNFIKNVATGIDKYQKYHVIGKWFKRWRQYTINLKVNQLKNDLSKKPREVIKEVFHDVPVIKKEIVEVEVIKEIPVVQKEFIEIVKQEKAAHKKSVCKSILNHINKIQKWYILGKYFRRWKRIQINQQIDDYKFELQKKPKETIKELRVEIPIIKTEIREVVKEIIKEVPNNKAHLKSLLKNIFSHSEKLRRFYFLSRYFRRWTRYIRIMKLDNLDRELQKKPKEILKEVEVIKEVPVVKKEFIEVIKEVPVFKKEIVEVVKEDRKSIQRNMTKALTAHLDKIKRWYLIGKFFRKWKRFEYLSMLNYYSNELSKKQKEAVIKEIENKIPHQKAMIKAASNHTDKLQRYYIIGRWFKKWRMVANLDKLATLKTELNKKPKEVIKEIIKEVPTIKTEIKEIMVEVPVIQKQIVEVIKEVPDKKAHQKSIIKSVSFHVDKIQKYNIIGKYFKRWINYCHLSKVESLNNELKKKPKEIIKEIQVPVYKTEIKEIIVEVPKKEIVEVVKEVPDKLAAKKSTLKGLCQHLDKLKRWYILGKYFRRWKKFIYSLQLNFFNHELNKRPKEVIKEIIVEVPKVVTEIREIKVEIPVIKKEIVEVVKEIPDKKAHQKSIIKSMSFHVYKMQRWNIIGKYFKRWKNATVRSKISQYEVELKKKPKEIVREVVKEVIREVPITKTIEICREIEDPKKKEAFKKAMVKSVTNHVEKLTRWILLGKAFRRWKKYIHKIHITELEKREIIKHIEVIKEIPIVKKEFIEVEKIIEIPIVKKEIVEVVKEVPVIKKEYIEKEVIKEVVKEVPIYKEIIKEVHKPAEMTDVIKLLPNIKLITPISALMMHKAILRTRLNKFIKGLNNISNDNRKNKLLKRCVNKISKISATMAKLIAFNKWKAVCKKQRLAKLQGYIVSKLDNMFKNKYIILKNRCYWVWKSLLNIRTDILRHLKGLNILTNALKRKYFQNVSRIWKVNDIGKTKKKSIAALCARSSVYLRQKLRFAFIRWNKIVVLSKADYQLCSKTLRSLKRIILDKFVWSPLTSAFMKWKNMRTGKLDISKIVRGYNSLTSFAKRKHLKSFENVYNNIWRKKCRGQLILKLLPNRGKYLKAFMSKYLTRWKKNIGLLFRKDICIKLLSSLYYKNRIAIARRFVSKYFKRWDKAKKVMNLGIFDKCENIIFKVLTKKLLNNFIVKLKSFGKFKFLRSLLLSNSKYHKKLLARFFTRWIRTILKTNALGKQAQLQSKLLSTTVHLRMKAMFLNVIRRRFVHWRKSIVNLRYYRERINPFISQIKKFAFRKALQFKLNLNIALSKQKKALLKLVKQASKKSGKKLASYINRWKVKLGVMKVDHYQHILKNKVLRNLIKNSNKLTKLRCFMLWKLGSSSKGSNLKSHFTIGVNMIKKTLLKNLWALVMKKIQRSTIVKRLKEMVNIYSINKKSWYFKKWNTKVNLLKDNGNARVIQDFVKEAKKKANIKKQKPVTDEKISRLLKRYVFRQIINLFKKCEKSFRMNYLINLCFMHKDIAKTRYIKHLIKKWRFAAYLAKMSKQRIDLVYTKLHNIYLNMTSELLESQQMSLLKDFETFSQDAGLFEGDDSSYIDQIRNKYVKDVKKRYYFETNNITNFNNNRTDRMNLPLQIKSTNEKALYENNGSYNPNVESHRSQLATNDSNRSLNYNISDVSRSRSVLESENENVYNKKKYVRTSFLDKDDSPREIQTIRINGKSPKNQVNGFVSETCVGNNDANGKSKIRDYIK
jgi:hypothetical protein